MFAVIEICWVGWGNGIQNLLGRPWEDRRTRQCPQSCHSPPQSKLRHLSAKRTLSTRLTESMGRSQHTAGPGRVAANNGQCLEQLHFQKRSFLHDGHASLLSTHLLSSPLPLPSPPLLHSAHLCLSSCGSGPAGPPFVNAEFWGRPDRFVNTHFGVDPTDLLTHSFGADATDLLTPRFETVCWQICRVGPKIAC